MQPDGGQFVRDRAEQARGRGQAVHTECVRPRLLVHSLREVLERRGIHVVAGDEADLLLQLSQDGRIDFAHCSVDAAAHVLAQLLAAPVAASHPDHRHGELPTLDEPVERRNEGIAAGAVSPLGDSGFRLDHLPVLST